MTAVDLAELARRANAGDSAARHELLTELYVAVRKYVYFLVRKSSLADDAVQDTMIAVYRGLPRFRGDANPRTWAVTIAHRSANVSRSRRRTIRCGRRFALVEAIRIDLGPLSDPAAATALADRMLAAWPRDALVPEARSLRCQALTELGRSGECAGSAAR